MPAAATGCKCAAAETRTHPGGRALRMHLGVGTDPGGTSLRHRRGSGSERARGRVLTGRGGRRPGSAEDAADEPEPQRCPAAGWPRCLHPSPPGSRYSESSLRRGAVRLSAGFSQGGGLPRTPEHAQPLPPPPPLGPSAAPGSSPAGLRAAGSRGFLLLRAGLAFALRARGMPEGRNSHQARKGGEPRRGHLPRPLPPRWGGRTKGRGGKSEECRMPEKKPQKNKIRVARRGRRGCCWWQCE